MSSKTLYDECPLCNQQPVVFDEAGNFYGCKQCGLTLKSGTLFGLFKKNNFSVVNLGQDKFAWALAGLKNISLAPDRLKVVIGNIYSDAQLAEIANGALEVIRPVRTVLAQIILEQLKETCFLQINGLRLGLGQALPEGGGYHPEERAPRNALDWQNQGNLFGTGKHLVLPSDRFTFIRLDRKLVGVQAFTDGVAVQRKGEEFATYFVGCLPHEAALAAAFVMGKAPAVRKPIPGRD